ncbi:hypothetical protein [Aminipila terrae]|uniref:YbjN domain-containing protein n=1 Tax=Aminipila terrae TaxID=2697030 RepID=A0A6P1MJ12_9FIRM|nr:hypothetical protein [Aminipila terrae]QHI72604.1 hypothetical protein Ami3637_09500 [Aminipila terrae]
MSLDMKKSVIKALQNRIEELNIENKIKEDFPFEGFDTLCTLTGVADGMSVLTETTVLDWNEENFIVQFYSTIAVNLKDSVMEELFKATEKLNILCPFGNFGIYREENQFYHKFSVLLEKDLEEKEFVNKIIKNLEAVFDAISDKVPLLAVFITGDMDYKTALEEDLF